MQPADYSQWFIVRNTVPNRLLHVLDILTKRNTSYKNININTFLMLSTLKTLKMIFRIVATVEQGLVYRLVQCM